MKTGYYWAVNKESTVAEIVWFEERTPDKIRCMSAAVDATFQ